MRTFPEPHFQAANGHRGFTLLEVILAMALFLMVALALTEALNQIGVTTLEASEKSRRLELIESHLIELTRSPQLLPGVQTIPVSDGTSKLEIEVTKAELTNQEGKPLPDTYLIRLKLIQAVPGGAEEVIEEAQTYRYAHLYAR